MNHANTQISDNYKIELLNKIISNKPSYFIDTEQVLLVFSKKYDSYFGELVAYEIYNKSWRIAFNNIHTVLGNKGYAKLNMKREGDGKSPSGIYQLGPSFGYENNIDTKLQYIQTDSNDYWVDDIESIDYNKWVKSKPNSSSFEKMKREDGLYKYGIIIQFNTGPIIKGKGSAIFLHVWEEDDSPTRGCVAISEHNIVKLLKWLDENKNPKIIMGEIHDII